MSSKVEGSTAPDVTWTGGAHVQGFGPLCKRDYHYMRVNLCLSRENMLGKHFLGFLLLSILNLTIKVYIALPFYIPLVLTIVEDNNAVRNITK